MSDARTFFPGIHALRFLAAVLVVLEHAAYVSKDYTLLGYSIAQPYFSYGRIGVILFFAISGFVIALQRKKPVGEFIAHRFLRIYPSYWLATAVAAFLFWLVARHIQWPSVASILLYPSRVGDDTFTIPYWTLIFEMTFYALAALAFAFRLSDRTLTVIAVLWIVAANLFAPPSTGNYTLDGAAYSYPGFPNILWSVAVQVFPIGLICGVHFEKLRQFGRWPYVIAASIAFLASVAFAELSAPKLLALGISASCLIVAVADLGGAWRHAVRRLGDASYGIYLLHFPAMLAAATISGGGGLLWFFAVGLGCGFPFGLFDRTLYRWLVSRLHDLPRLHRTRSSFPPRLSS
jgi:exopolysaccharide production protein ExoZ